MLLDLEKLVKKYQMDITGVLHLGAHLGEEAAIYTKLGIKNVTWVDANPGVIAKLNANLAPFGWSAINALLTDVDHETVRFNVTNHDGMSSSIYEFGQLHLDSSPETKFIDRLWLETTTLDTLVAEHHLDGFNFINMDLQGAEYLVLKGGAKTLEKVDYIYCEVNEDYVYKDIHLVGDIDELLTDFKRVETGLTPARWGDAIYCRKGV